MDTDNTAKTLAYILLVCLLPIGGAIIYFTFGINYRKRKIFSKKVISNESLLSEIEITLLKQSEGVLATDDANVKGNEDLIRLLLKDSKATLSYNKVRLLINGEEKFKEVIIALQNAKTFIHLEYYIFEDDKIGRTIIDLLKQKAQAGIQVRFIYDDFGSHALSDNTIEEMRDTGIEIFPFYEVKFYLLANRINYRDHRKIIIVDGLKGFIGGINVSDKYVNDPASQQLYWRDTHIMIEGPAVNNLQYHFIANWNFCAETTLHVTESFFPLPFEKKEGNDDLVQIVAGGPDYSSSAIMLSFFKAISQAQDKVYITSPYFIPNESIKDALKSAALSGKDVRLILPGVSDSKLVNAAARSYFGELLYSGVRIYLYQKGFIHSKTMVIDNSLSIVGSANMDGRSFDLNFEINAVIYSEPFCKELTTSFENDLKDSIEVSLEDWIQRPWWKELFDAIARLFSPLL